MKYFIVAGFSSFGIYGILVLMRYDPGAAEFASWLLAAAVWVWIARNRVKEKERGSRWRHCAAR